MFNGLDVEAIKETCSVIQEDPEMAKTQFRIHNTWQTGGHNKIHVKGYFAAGEEKTHEGTFDFNADEPPVMAGTDIGPNPVEYLLTALSGCMTTTIIYHAALKGIEIESMESDFEGDLDVRGFLDLSKDVPKGYQTIKVTFTVKMDGSLDDLAGLYKFSPVYSMVSPSVPIEVNFVKK